jgi:hypothetical protein
MTKSHPSNLCPLQNFDITQSCHDGREEATIGWSACCCGRPFYLLPAGITDPGHNGVPNQQKTAGVTKGAATLETNFVLLVVFCSAL